MNHDKRDGKELVCDVDVEEAMLHENIINPPFAAAAPLMGAAAIGGDVLVPVDSLVLSDKEHPLAFAEEDQQQDRESFRLSPGPQSIVAEAVYFNEVSGNQEQYEQGQNDASFVNKKSRTSSKQGKVE
jgi:hypothetical protein